MRSVPPPDPGGIFTGPVEVLKRNPKQNKYDSLWNGFTLGWVKMKTALEVHVFEP